MSTVIQKVLGEANSFGIAWQKIKCPRHYLLIPGKKPFKVKPHPLLGKQTAAKTYDLEIGGHKVKFRNWVFVKDKNGNKIQEHSSYYQPSIPKSYAIEHIYDPLNPICQNQCKRRCMEGMGNVNLYAIKRFSGSPFKLADA